MMLDLAEPGPHVGNDWPVPACQCADCCAIRQTPAYKRRQREIREQLLDHQRKALR